VTDPDPSGPGLARDLVAAHHGDRVSVLATAEATLARIADVEPDLRAFAHLDPAAVLERARELDAVPPSARGPLHGLPVGLKDIIDTEDAPTAYGSPIHAGHRPERDAIVVGRLRAAGALIVGKTVTTEFALFTPGPTRNPHDPTRTPGGSSSGSAAAVAAGLLPIALGTQTAGSVVRPASFCGIVGAKPTFGRVPFDGVKLCSEHLDTLGVLARDAADAALVLAVMADEPVPSTDARSQGRPRIGWWPGAAPARMDDDARAIVDASVASLADGGDVEIVEVELPTWFGDLIAAQQVLMRHEAWGNLALERTRHAELLSPGLRAYLAEGPDAAGAAAALVLAERGREAVAAALGGFDALLTPSVVGEASERTVTGDPVFCRTWTLLGGPAVAVPGLRGPAGLPLGVQLVGPVGSDARVLAVADRLAPLLGAL